MPELTAHDTLDIIYRPKNLKDLIGQDHIVKILNGMFSTGKVDRAIMLYGPSGSGKAQPLYSKIKTPGGWTQMGNIKIGDTVNTPDGKTAPVTDIFPQGIKDVYRITFEDGRTTDCCGDHLWNIFCHDWNPKWKILSLKDIEFHKNNRKHSLYIPLTDSTYNEEKDLPLDPYVLGCLLGDGSFTNSIKFSNIDIDILKNITNRLVDGYCLKKVKGFNCDYLITRLNNNLDTKGHLFRKGNKLHYYCKVVADLGLENHHSWEKFIPEIYKEASVEQRLELLQGLMDTDGEVGKALSRAGNHSGGSISYSTSSHQLALDVQYLVRSLGGLCKISIRKTFYTYKGIRKQGRTSLRCNIRYDFPETFIKLDRKKERAVKVQDNTLKCKIKSIKYVGASPCQCIMVDHPDHLYITDGFVVTHNTTTARLIARYANCMCDEFLGGECITCQCEYIEDHPDIMEINAAKATGIDNIRELISQAQYMPQTNFRIFILDEAQQISTAGKECLLTEMEEAKRKGESVLWVVCTTEPEKFKNTFLGRCTKLQIKPVEPRVLAKRLYKIALLEKSPIAEDKKSLIKIASLVRGQPRDGLKALGKVIHYLNGSGKIDTDIISSIVQEVIDVPSEILLSKYLLSVYSGSLAKSFNYLNKTENAEYFLKSLIEYHTNVLYSQIDESLVIKYPPFINLNNAFKKQKFSIPILALSDMLVDMTKTYSEVKNYAINAKLLINSMTCRIVQMSNG